MNQSNAVQSTDYGENPQVVFINPRDLVGCVPYVKLANLAGVLRDGGISSVILEPTAQALSTDDIIESINSIQPKVVCIGAFPSTLPDAYELTKALKRSAPSIQLVLEGYHVNADPSILTEIGIGWGIRGDAEMVFLNLCKHLLFGNEIDLSQPGLVYVAGGNIHDNGPATIDDINKLPLPAYDLLTVDKYYSASTNKIYMQLFTTRGCPYTCSFCANPTQMGFRHLSNDKVLEHLEVLVNQCGVEWVEFMDLTFTVNRKRTISMCQAIIDSGIIFEWGCETRADLIDEELLTVMKAAGCSKVTFGVESGVERVRYRTGKKITDNQFINAFNLCRKNGIKTMANFIIGHPDETKEEMRETIRFAVKLKPFNVLFTRMIPMPDVEIYSIGIKEGQFTNRLWAQYMKGEIDHPTYVPNTVTKPTMDRMYSLAYCSYYLSAHAIRNYLPMMSDLRFVRQSLYVFFRMTFGKPVFK